MLRSQCIPASGNPYRTDPARKPASYVPPYDDTRIGAYPEREPPIAVAFDGTNIWVTNNGSSRVTKLNTSDGSQLGTYRTTTE